MINKQDSLTGREIAVIGMSGRFPGARNLKEFWSNLKNGVEAVRLLGDEELVAAGEDPRHLSDPHYVKAASMLDDVGPIRRFFLWLQRQGSRDYGSSAAPVSGACV